MNSKTNPEKYLVIVAAFLFASCGQARADFTFSEPTNIGPIVNSSYSDSGVAVSADGLLLFFHSDRPGGSGQYDIWVTTRATKEDDWVTPVNLGQTVNSSAHDLMPSISADDLTLFFASDRPGGCGGRDLWVTTRPTKDDEWGEPVNLATVNSSDWDFCPCISADGLRLFFSSVRPGGLGWWDIWVTTRATKDDDWSAPVNLGPTVSSSFGEGGPSISADSCTLFFNSNERPGGCGDRDIWVTTRATIDDDWGIPVNLGPTVNTAWRDYQPSILDDGSTLFFDSTRPGGFGGHDIYQLPIIPIVDLNGDGIVDAADMCIIVDYWGTDEPLCDIGPTPLGDGVVDVQDLIVLAEHLFEEFPPVETVE